MRRNGDRVVTAAVVSIQTVPLDVLRRANEALLLARESSLPIEVRLLCATARGELDYYVGRMLEQHEAAVKVTA